MVSSSLSANVIAFSPYRSRPSESGEQHGVYDSE
jgi:hypothetical protein